MTAGERRPVYLDHAATSWPKPPGVARAMTALLEEAGGNPGRSGHSLSIEAGRRVYEAREAVGRLLGAASPERVVFTLNATHALNVALAGILRPGDRVVTSSMEHNSVMRPLRALEERGVEVGVVPCAPDGTLDPADLARALRPRTRLVALTHASNVCGAILPVEEAARLAREAGARILVDAAQTAGALPVDVEASGLDLLAFTGHKGLLGPPGTGGLVIGSRVDPGELEPILRGGTGSRSEKEVQPDFLPDRFESGTPNAAGLAGLREGVRWLEETGVAAVRERERSLADRLLAGLRGIPGVEVRGPADPARTTGTVAFTVAGRSVAEIGGRLDEEHGVLCRVGLHCSPAAHRTLGTFPAGTVRFAPGPFTTEAEIDAALAALRAVLAA